MTVQVQLALGCGNYFIDVVPVLCLPLLLFGLGFLTFHTYCESSLGLFPSKRKLNLFPSLSRCESAGHKHKKSKVMFFILPSIIQKVVAAIFAFLLES